jgi:ubiquinone/menaquinone biosynthesis C-methylase UbiE
VNQKLTDFTEIAKKYEKDSLVQKSASEQLFDLLKINPTDDVLDLGCGAGNLTKKIAELTKGKVVGVDASEGMIREAKKNYSGRGINFEVCPVENLNYTDCFDVIFCNSAFQWFKHPQVALKMCFNALRANGRMGIQAPGGKAYCPNFIAGTQKVAADPYLSRQFANFNPPWNFMETSKEYVVLFEDAGFKVLHAAIDQTQSFHSPEEALKIFDSGAAAGYLNEQYYSCSISEGYKAAFRQVMLESFKEQTNSEGKVNLVFYRVFLVAKKP